MRLTTCGRCFIPLGVDFAPEWEGCNHLVHGECSLCFRVRLEEMDREMDGGYYDAPF